MCSLLTTQVFFINFDDLTMSDYFLNVKCFGFFLKTLLPSFKTGAIL